MPLWHTHPPPYEGFFERVQPIYEDDLVEGWRPPPSRGMSEAGIAAAFEELASSGLFVSLERRSEEWSRT